MEEYQKDVLIDELQKLVVSKTIDIRLKDFEISRLKKEVERLEAQAKENK